MHKKPQYRAETKRINPEIKDNEIHLFLKANPGNRFSNILINESFHLAFNKVSDCNQEILR